MQIRDFPFFALRVQWNDDGTKKKNCARTEYFYGHLYLARIFIVWKSGVAGSRNKMKWNVFVHFSFCLLLFVYGGKETIQNEKKNCHHTNLSASVNDCGAFGGLNSVLCYYLKKKLGIDTLGKLENHSRWPLKERRNERVRRIFALEHCMSWSLLWKHCQCLTVLTPLKYCRSREGIEMDASTRQQRPLLAT